MTDINVSYDISQVMNLTADAENDVPVTISVEDGGGNYDFTNHSARFDLVRSQTDTEIIFSLSSPTDITLSSGQISFTIPYTQLTPHGAYYYHLTITDDSDVRRRWFEGTFTLNP